jgi:hypothetical protein
MTFNANMTLFLGDITMQMRIHCRRFGILYYLSIENYFALEKQKVASTIQLTNMQYHYLETGPTLKKKFSLRVLKH